MENNNRQGCRWVKCSDRLPDKLDGVHYRFSESKLPVPYRGISKEESFGNTFLRFFLKTFDIKNYAIGLIEWLDESIEPCATSSRIEELEKDLAVLKNMNDKLWEALIRNLPQYKLDLIKNALDFLTK